MDIDNAQTPMQNFLRPHSTTKWIWYEKYINLNFNSSCISKLLPKTDNGLFKTADKIRNSLVHHIHTHWGSIAQSVHRPTGIVNSFNSSR